MNPTHSTALDEKIREIISKMQMRISNAWEAWDGAEPENADESWEKYGDESDAAERVAHTAIKNLVLEAKRNLVAIGRERIDNDPTYTLEAFIEDCEEYLDRTELTTKKEQE